MSGPVDPDWPAGARDLVQRSRVARLATVDEDGWPHVLPVCYALVGNLVYSVVDAKPKREALRLKRLRNIAANSHVALVVDVYDDDWSRLAWVLLRGDARLVADEVEYGRAVRALRRRYAQYETMPLRVETNPMIRIDVVRVGSWRHGPSGV